MAWTNSSLGRSQSKSSRKTGEPGRFCPPLHSPSPRHSYIPALGPAAFRSVQDALEFDTLPFGSYRFVLVRSHHVAMAGPELTMKTRLASNSQKYAQLCLLSTGAKSVCPTPGPAPGFHRGPNRYSAVPIPLHEEGLPGQHLCSLKSEGFLAVTFLELWRLLVHTLFC